MNIIIVSGSKPVTAVSCNGVKQSLETSHILSIKARAKRNASRWKVKLQEQSNYNPAHSFAFDQLEKIYHRREHCPHLDNVREMY